MTDPEDRWVVVRSCNWLHEALFVKSVLDGAGIDAQIPNQYTLAVQPGYAPALGGVRVLVRNADLDRAAELLDTEAGSSADDSLDD